MRIYLLLFFLFISNLAGSQITNGIYPLITIQPTDTSFTDLKQLDTFFQNKTIIGIGESTHGTSEFTTMRHRIFKYLVEHHNFNTFFLEADFGACERINRYVHGENDTLLQAIRGIQLWPWMTEEMKIFIEWMKDYNTENGNNLAFAGCDMQFINDDIEEIKKLPGINKIINGLLDSMIEPEKFYYKKDTAFLSRNIKYWQMAQRLIDTTLFSDQENITYDLLKNGINQFYEDFTIKNIYSNHRDSCMGTNMFLYTQKYPESKGIYFAHNGHVQKWKNDRGKFGTWKSAGQFARELMGKKYFCILQDFYEGKLLAVNLKEKKLQVFESVSKNKNNLGYYFHSFDESILFCPIENIPEIENKSMRSIGAVFENSRAARNQKRYYGSLNIEMFDAIIFIRQSSPTTYLFQKN